MTWPADGVQRRDGDERPEIGAVSTATLPRERHDPAGVAGRHEPVIREAANPKSIKAAASEKRPRRAEDHGDQPPPARSAVAMTQ